MFQLQTTIVLGAGASNHAGFPLGESLLKMVRDDLETYLQGGSKRSGRFARVPTDFTSFRDNGCSALISYLMQTPAREFLPPSLDVGQAISTFLGDLQRQEPASLDQFIYENPRHVFFGKALLATYVLLNLYDDDGGSGVLRDFSAHSLGGVPNWYALLARRMREGAASGHDILSNRLHIVTFNYDISLELALGKLLAMTERHRDAQPFSNVYHVNGAPKDVPNRINDVGKFVLKAAEDIHMFREPGSQDVEEQRAKAGSAIQNSEAVYVLGFSFEQTNVDNIGLTSRRAPCYVLNFDGEVALERRAKKCNATDFERPEGTPTLSVYDAIAKRGFLERSN